MHAKSHLTNDRYQSSYTWNNNKQEDQRCSNVLTFSSESCRTSCLAALDLESRTRSADRPLPVEKPIQEVERLEKNLQSKLKP